MLPEELFEPSWRSRTRQYLRYAGLFFGAAVMIYWIYLLVLGERSFGVLRSLRVQKSELEKSVRFYRQQNAALQKEIFEIIGVK